MTKHTPAEMVLGVAPVVFADLSDGDLKYLWHLWPILRSKSDETEGEFVEEVLGTYEQARGREEALHKTNPPWHYRIVDCRCAK